MPHPCHHSLIVSNPYECMEDTNVEDCGSILRSGVAQTQFGI